MYNIENRLNEVIETLEIKLSMLKQYDGRINDENFLWILEKTRGN